MSEVNKNLWKNRIGNIKNPNVLLRTVLKEPTIEIIEGGINHRTGKLGGLAEYNIGVDVSLKISNVNNLKSIRLIQIVVFSNDDNLNDKDVADSDVPIYKFQNGQFLGRTDPPYNLFYYDYSIDYEQRVSEYSYDSKTGICNLRWLDKPTVLLEENPYKYNEFTTYIVKISLDNKLEVIGKLMHRHELNNGSFSKEPREVALYRVSYFTDDAKNIIKSDKIAYKKYLNYA